MAREWLCTGEPGDPAAAAGRLYPFLAPYLTSLLPAKQDDLAQARPEVVASLLEELERRVERARLGALEGGGPRDVEITDSDRQRLREPGYLGSDG